MSKIKFQFKNQSCCQEYQKEHLPEKSLKSFIVFSSVFVFVVFLCLKSISSEFHFLSNNKLFSNPPEKGEAYVFPLLVNLKGETGPQLARVQVHIHLNKERAFVDSLSEDNQFKKYLLFILSGQSTQKIGKNKNSLEKQIRVQLNAFLNEELVNGVRIQMEKIN